MACSRWIRDSVAGIVPIEFLQDENLLSLYLNLIFFFCQALTFFSTCVTKKFIRNTNFGQIICKSCPTEINDLISCRFRQHVTQRKYEILVLVGFTATFIYTFLYI